MRVVEVNMLHNGSTGKIMLGIADCARSIGDEVWLFSPIVYQRGKKVKPPFISQHTYFGSRFENMLHLILAELSGMPGCFSVIGTKRLLNEIDRLQPDVLHLHNLHNCTINLPMLFSYIKRKNIKVIWTLHDCWSFTGKCPHFSMVKCDKWKLGCYNCPQLRIYPKAYVDQTQRMWKLKKKWFCGVKDMTLVTPSQWLADLAKESFLKEYPIRVIHNGIDLSVFKPTESDFQQKHRLEDKKLVLGVAFGWGERKGLDVFFELRKRLPQEYQIVLVGTDERVDAQLPEGILSIHRTNNQNELAEIYSAADVFVIPTREENYPTVNLESLACGTPVITFRTGGSPECIDETCGIVVEPEDLDGLEHAIVEVCEKRPFSKEACVKRATKNDQKTVFREYVSLYHS